MTTWHLDMAEEEQIVNLARCVEMAYQGASIRAMAERIERSDAYVRGLLTEPEGQEALRQHGEELMAAASGFTITLSIAALRLLARAMASDEVGWRDKIAAAGKVLDLHTKHSGLTVSGLQPGQAVLVSDTDDLAWLTERAATLRAQAITAEAVEAPIVEVSA